MQRIDSVDGLFHEGNPATGTRGTKVTAVWLNELQETVIDLPISSSIYDSLTAAVAAIGATESTLLIKSATSITADTIIPVTLSVICEKGGSITTAGFALTINGPFSSGPYQCFVGLGSVSFAAGAVPEVLPEWFPNASVYSACQSLPASGGVVKLQSTVYGPLGTMLTKDNVKIIGTQQPVSNPGNTGLTGGSIIKGPFVYAANNLTFQDFGVDSGSDVCTAMYSGVPQEGLVCTVAYYSSTTQLKNLRIRNIAALCQSATAAVHAFAAEGYDNADIDGIVTVYGTHGQAYKVRNSKVNNLISKGNSSNGIILKSQRSPVRQMRDSTFSNIIVTAVASTQVTNKTTVTDTGAGVKIESHNGEEVANIELVNISTLYTTSGISLVAQASGDIIRDITITNAVLSSSHHSGVELALDVRRVKFIGVTSNTANDFGFVTSSGSSFISFVDCTANNNSSGFVNYGIDNDIISCTAQDNTGHGFFAKTGSSTFRAGCRGSGNGIALFGADSNTPFFSRSLLTTGFNAATLSNSWVNYGSGSYNIAGYILDDAGWVTLRGLVKNGTINNAILNLPAGLRPLQTMHFPVTTYNGSAVVIGEVYINSGGDVVLGSGGTNYVSLDGIRFLTVS